MLAPYFLSYNLVIHSLVQMRQDADDLNALIDLQSHRPTPLGRYLASASRTESFYRL
jgi:hypothetical protein